MSKFYVRAAQKQDISIVFKFIKLIAEYEKMSEHVLTNEESLEKELFFKKSAEVIVGFEDDKPVAFALYYYNFSTFLGT
ncbi:MAG: GNAT family N-acetyltransferase, partial [Oscillospiraceae bacterium]